MSKVLHDSNSRAATRHPRTHLRALPAHHPRGIRAVSARHPRLTRAVSARYPRGTSAGYSPLTLPPRRGKKIIAQGKQRTSAALGYPGQIVLPFSPSDGERGWGEGSSINPTTTTNITKRNRALPRSVHSTKWNTLRPSHLAQFELASISVH
jgi:hypothetical protein